MDIQGLQRIVRTGLFSLANSLASYWPPYGDKGMAERNLTGHVAAAFLAEGFDAYFEVPLADNSESYDTTERIDALFISYQHEIFIVVEAKKLYGAEKANEIIKDIGRIKAFELQEQNIDIQNSYGLILAETWDIETAEWWISYNDSLDPNGEFRWNDLRNKLQELKDKYLEVEAITLQHNLMPNSQKDKYEAHKGLYALWCR